ncbi:hypothetical protein SAMN05421666_0292 [Roseovarius nanhaiticus]|uniref:Uncharacterized protein n=1 Tax=Roseovarius nanhaiticus TaxID=573024 RepID=A0A1N7EJC9_9RHOB|nr:hypothetical protein SAMN05216208_1842 [Roseovarius nanhaiticus]SIR88196.1 hypothetical protein SAMN05421666_0292 [Roseovarius nanhaiticus]
MFRTIKLGTCVLIQGIFVRSLPDGRIQIADGDKVYTGLPVS